VHRHTSTQDTHTHSNVATEKELIKGPFINDED
jgi:hypothetical protein